MRTILALCLAIPLCCPLSAAVPEGIFESRFAKSAPPMEADPTGLAWQKAPLVVAAQDRFGKPLLEARTEIRSLWTATDLYFLFTAKYESIYLRSLPQLDRETHGLWDFRSRRMNPRLPSWPGCARPPITSP